VNQELRRRAASIVDAYDETLAAIGAPKLTEDQRDALEAFLVLLYERAREHGGADRRDSPPLVG
jgi:hypothetical protein